MFRGDKSIYSGRESYGCRRGPCVEPSRNVRSEEHRTGVPGMKRKDYGESLDLNGFHPVTLEESKK